MKIRLYNIIVIIICISEILIISGCIPISYNQRKDDEKDISTMIEESRTKEAFLRVQDKLKQIYVGMPMEELDKLTIMYSLTKGGKVIDVIGDGWLRPLGGKIREKDGWVIEFVYGYIMRGIAVQKLVVQVKDDKVYNIIDLESEDLGPIDMRKVEIKDFNNSDAREAFLKTKEKLKNVSIGMNKRKAFIKIGGSTIAIDNEFFYDAPGYLRNLYSYKEVEDNVIEELYFGYIENKKEIPQFVIKVINNRISEIKLLDSVQDLKNNQATVFNSSCEKYYKTIYDLISKAIVKPLESGAGVINAEITLLADGTLQDIKILDGSVESMALRKAVVRAIKKVAPFPPFPEEMKQESTKTFTITIEFK